VKCPVCGKDRYNVYSSDEPVDDGKCISVLQYRRCKNCGFHDRTLQQRWYCHSLDSRNINGGS
jgi:transcriptional regulator NrdR family protein